MTTLRDPGDVIAMVPYVLGFTPVDSMVMVALVGQRKRFGACLRLDLPHSPADGSAVARYLVGVASAHRFGTVLLVAFTPDERRAAQVMQPLRRDSPWAASRWRTLCGPMGSAGGRTPVMTRGAAAPTACRTTPTPPESLRRPSSRV